MSDILTPQRLETLQKLYFRWLESDCCNSEAANEIAGAFPALRQAFELGKRAGFDAAKTQMQEDLIDASAKWQVTEADMRSYAEMVDDVVNAIQPTQSHESEQVSQQDGARLDWLDSQQSNFMVRRVWWAGNMGDVEVSGILGVNGDVYGSDVRTALDKARRQAERTESHKEGPTPLAGGPGGKGEEN